jgi:hypothetical protein
MSGSLDPSDSQSSLSSLTSSEGTGKVAVPRLSNGPGEKNYVRTPSACVICRAKKAKCDGERPRCRTCQRMDRICTYTTSKRATQRLQLQSLQQKAQLYEVLLGDIISQGTIRENISIENIIKVHHRTEPNLPSLAKLIFNRNIFRTPQRFLGTLLLRSL